MCLLVIKIEYGYTRRSYNSVWVCVCVCVVSSVFTVYLMIIINKLLLFYSVKNGNK